MSLDYQRLLQEYADHFGAAPEAGARAPGRVNLIGEHTDYNGGYVLPLAIDRETVVIGRVRPGQVLKLYAHNLGETATVDLAQPVRSATTPWADYVAGVASAFQRAGHELPGGELLIAGDVPLGCGLSSSAALEMAVLRYFEGAVGAALTDGEAARLGQWVENEFLGLSSGIMDQFICRAGKVGHALFLQCETFEHRHVAVKLTDVRFVIADSRSPRGLTDSAYNQRVRECGEALACINSLANAQYATLSQVPDDIAEDLEDKLSGAPGRRFRHVRSENARTLQALAALEAGDTARLGALMDASHESLRRDYEVTGEALDTLAGLARAHPGCHGARMTGAGFGGCTINLVDAGAVSSFTAYLEAAYEKETGRIPVVFDTVPVAGASVLELEWGR